MVYELTLTKHFEDTFELICKAKSYVVGDQIIYFRLHSVLNTVRLTDCINDIEHLPFKSQTIDRNFEKCKTVDDNLVYLEHDYHKCHVIVLNKYGNTKFRTTITHRSDSGTLVASVKTKDCYLFGLLYKGYEYDGIVVFYDQDGQEREIIDVSFDDNTKFDAIVVDDKLYLTWEDSEEDILAGTDFNYYIYSEVSFDSKLLYYAKGEMMRGDTTYLTYRESNDESTTYLIKLTRELLHRYKQGKGIPEVEPSFIINNPLNIECELIKVDEKALYFSSREHTPYHSDNLKLLRHRVPTMIKSARNFGNH